MTESCGVRGYHVTEIPRGEYGFISKVHEEALEAVDADDQNNPIMVLIELSDIVGAIKGYLERHYDGKITFDDVVKMADRTRCAFQSGARK